MRDVQVDFAAHARALGAIGEQVQSIAELDEALTRARAADRTTVISIAVDKYGWSPNSAWWEVGVPEVSGKQTVLAAAARWQDGAGEAAARRLTPWPPRPSTRRSGRNCATLFRWRRDVRRFRSDAVPPALLDELIDLACLAPSVGLSQPWRFVTVDDPARRARVRANFLACNAARAGRAAAGARGAVRAAQARRAGRGALPSRGVRRPGDRPRVTAWGAPPCRRRRPIPR